MRRVGAVLAVAITLTACTNGATGADPSTSAPPPETPETAMVAPAAPTSERTAAPRVLLAGDSIMGDLRLAAGAALQAAGAANVYFDLVPALPRSPAQWATWRAVLARRRPDVVVVLVGVWERVHPTADGSRVGDPGWPGAYRGEVLEPFAASVRATGARLVFVGMPTVRDPVANGHFAALAASFADLAAHDAGVHFADGAAALVDGEGAAAEFLQGADGRVERVRQTDGTHLCPDGAVRLARVVVAAIGLPSAGGWEDGDWRTVAAMPAERCPPTA